MSRIRANTITNQNANGAPNFPDGITVSGVVTATTTSQNITGDLSVTGNIGVGGTITYEDVTNVDSVGIITARSGIRIGTGGTVGPSGAGIVTYFGDGSQLTGIDATQIATGNTKVQTVASRVDTKVDNVGILTVTAAGANVTGIVTANTFSGGGLGRILQVTEGIYNVQVTIQGATSVTGLAGTITPQAAGSKILVIANQQGQIRVDSDPSQVINFYLDRDVNSGGYNQIQYQQYLGGNYPNNRRSNRMTTITQLDTPTYSLGQAISYRMRAGTYTSNYGLRYTAQTNAANSESRITLMEIAQ